MKARRKWFLKKKTKKTAETIIYALSSLSAQNRGEKKLMGKLNEKKNGGVKMLMTKRHTRSRSSDQHRLLLLTVLK